MQAFLTGITLALAGQVAQGNPYDTTSNVQDQAAAAAASQGEVAAATGSPDAQLEIIPQAATPADNAYPGASPVTPKLPGEVAAAGGSAAIPLGNQFRSPATAEPELAPQRSLLVEGPKPSELMKSLLKPPVAGQLSGVAVTLGEAVRDARSRQEQTERAKVYWDLSAAVADYYLALLEATELQVLRQGVTAPAQYWDAKQKEAQTRVEVARRVAQAAQLRLHQFLGRSLATSLPLPSDVPHCGRYNAEYEEIFARRPDPVAKQLAELLPLRHADLRAQSQSVAEAVEWRAQVSQRRNPNSDGTELLHAQDLLSLKRRAFIATARDYNQEIAAYTELAAPAEVATDRLVAMMIRISTARQPPWTSGSVQQATASEEMEPIAQPETPPSAPGRPQTFAAEGQREAWRPLQRLLNRDREHSIVSRVRRLRDRDRMEDRRD